MTAPAIHPVGFPDTFSYALLQALTAHVPSGHLFTSRPVRPDDPTRTIAVVEGEAEPLAYEIGGQMAPSMLQWNVAIQVFAKAANEIDGRNARRLMMRDCRKALFLPSTVTALMTLSDDTERVSSFRMARLSFSPVQARDAKGQFFFLGQIALTFVTEHL